LRAATTPWPRGTTWTTKPPAVRQHHPLGPGLPGRQGPYLPAADGFPRKVKPLYRLGEYENACFAFLKGIRYATAACPYSQGASFTGHKALLETLELRSPGAKIAFYDGFLARGRPAFERMREASPRPLVPCAQCGAPDQRVALRRLPHPRAPGCDAGLGLVGRQVGPKPGRGRGRIPGHAEHAGVGRVGQGNPCVGQERTHLFPGKSELVARAGAGQGQGGCTRP
jgi:hypothetical protein